MIAVFCILFFAACQNMFDPPKAVSGGVSGTGTLLLTIGEEGAGRTILPKTVESDFVRFELVFTPSAGCTAGNSALPMIPWTSNANTIELNVGVWDLEVTAFLSDDAGGFLAAAGNTRTNISIPSGGVVPLTVQVLPLETGPGTFSWAVAFNGSFANARMEIWRLEESGEDELEDYIMFIADGVANNGTFDRDTELPAGLYRVIFRLTNSESKSFVISELLHVYTNMDSRFPMDDPVFTFNADFPVTLLELILGAWDGDNWQQGDIEAGHFTHILGINGITNDNFAAIIGWFDTLFAVAEPADIDALTVLVDAALVGVTSEDDGFLEADYATRADAEAAIEEAVSDSIKNGSDTNIAWLSCDTAIVEIGSYTVEFIFTDGIHNFGDNWQLVTDPVITGEEANTCLRPGCTAGSVTRPAQATAGLAFTAIAGGFSVARGTATAAIMIIPAEHNGQPVTQIANSGFHYYTVMTGIFIPASVTSIGTNAFTACTGLTSVTIGNNVTSIGNGAFINCSALTSIAIPASVTTIYDSAFRGCTGLTSITIPASVTSIGSWVFNGCINLESIELPAVSQLFSNMFGGSADVPASLKTVVINGGTSIGNWAFENCTGLTSITIADSVTSIGDWAFSGCTGLTSIIIPASVTSIGDVAFRNCYSLTSITIGNNVRSIGAGAFSGCTGLTNITIPGSVISIGSQAFQNCTGLTSIDVDSNNPNYASQDGILYNKAQTELLAVPGAISGDITIPGSVISIGNQAFQNCTGLTGITMSVGVESIGNQAFVGCIGLTSITIPGSVISIDNQAFRDCTGLTSITIPGSVMNIGNGAFQNTGIWNTAPDNSIVYADKWAVGVKGNITGDLSLLSDTMGIGTSAFVGRGLTSITLPESVIIIGERAFSNCTGLTSVTIGNNVTSIGAGAFIGCIGLTNIDVDSNNPNYASQNGILYNKAMTEILAVPPSISGDITIPAGVISIGEQAFFGCTGITSVTIPGSVISIGNMAFQNCTGLTSITLPESVIIIGERAFVNCTGLTSVTIGNNVTSIGAGAFANCTSLTSITIPASVTIIGTVGPSGFFTPVFDRCTSLTNIDVDSNNPNYASQNGILYNKALTELLAVPGAISGDIIIPDSVTSIGERAFANCTGLTSITIPASVTSIGRGAFSGCTGLESIELPALSEGFASIFGWPSASLKTVVINGGTAIPDSSFGGYSNIESITIADSVTSIGDYAFSGCTGLTSITIPASVTSIGMGAFSGCTGLANVTVLRADPITTLGQWVFGNTHADLRIEVPAGSVAAYKAGDNWSGVANRIHAIGCTDMSNPCGEPCN